jgi:serine protease Do
MKEKSDAIVRILSNNTEIDIFSPYKVKSDSESIGTGFFINNDGYILTCAHVVDTGVKLWINSPLEGKKKIEVYIHSICYDKDCALLKTLDYKNKHFCTLGDSNIINGGDSVSAMGYPLGQERLKVTKGVVSGIQDRYIQTDAPINPGNSGGPLFDQNNNVIGINTAKISSFLAENIGYAMPVNEFKIILEKMMLSSSTKIIKEPALYFTYQITDNMHYKLFKCTLPHGCLIKKIIQNSPLWNAGVRTNDILTEFDVYKVDGHGDVDVEWSQDKININDLIPRYIVGKNVDIKYWSTSQNKEIKSQVVLQADDMYAIRKIRYPLEDISYEIFMGLIVMELTMNHLENLADVEYDKEIKLDLYKYVDITKRSRGVVFISGILQGSHASSLEELTPGSIITNVNGQNIESINDFKNAIKNYSFKLDGQPCVYFRLKNRNQFVLNVMECLKEEQTLQSRYKYQISSLYSHIR